MGERFKGYRFKKEDWVMNPSLQTLINVPSNAATKINCIFTLKSIVMFFDTLNEKPRIYFY